MSELPLHFVSSEIMKFFLDDFHMLIALELILNIVDKSAIDEVRLHIFETNLGRWFDLFHGY